MLPAEELNPRTGLGGVGPVDPTGDERHDEILYGLWVTSYSGFAQAIPPILDSAAPPVTGGYKWNSASQKWEQREGHFITSALIYFLFDRKGNVSGYAEHNRGDTGQHRKFSLNGTYEAWKSDAGLGQIVYWGRIFTTRPSGQPANYYFVMRSAYEIEWLAIPPAEPDLIPDPNNPRRPIIARGTMTKVMSRHWLRRAIQWLVFG